MARFGADIPGVLVAIEAIALVIALGMIVAAQHASAFYSLPIRKPALLKSNQPSRLLRVGM
jgi:hypothetical protein